MMKWWSNSVCAVCLLWGIPAFADSLDLADRNLGRVVAEKLESGLEIVIDVGDDNPTATHIIARFQNNQPLMRGADGLWAPWNGDPQALEDAGASLADRRLTFYVFDQLPADMFYPVSFTVAYRTPAGLKSGTLTLDAP